MTWFNRIVLGLLESPLHALLGHRLCELRYLAPSDGREIRLPAQYARSGDQLVVLVGWAPRKRWWRAFLRPHPVRVLVDGEWLVGQARVLHPDHPASQAARERYLERHRVRIRSDDRLVVVTGLRARPATGPPPRPPRDLRPDVPGAWIG